MILILHKTTVLFQKYLITFIQLIWEFHLCRRTLHRLLKGCFLFIQKCHVNQQTDQPIFIIGKKRREITDTQCCDTDKCYVDSIGPGNHQSVNKLNTFHIFRCMYMYFNPHLHVISSSS